MQNYEQFIQQKIMMNSSKYSLRFMKLQQQQEHYIK